MGNRLSVGPEQANPNSLPNCGFHRGPPLGYESSGAPTAFLVFLQFQVGLVHTRNPLESFFIVMIEPATQQTSS